MFSELCTSNCWIIFFIVGQSKRNILCYSFLLQMEEFLAGKGAYKMPPAEGQDTIFEYLVNEQGEWEHWSDRVGGVHCLWSPKDL